MTDFEHILQDAAAGNVAAHQFLLMAAHHFHAVDDVVDRAPFEPLAYLETLRQMIELYSHPFYLNHLATLKGTALAVLRCYRDSVTCERATEAAVWHRPVGDVLRCAGNELVIAVAQLIGGTAHADTISQRLRALSWLEHHDTAGQPI